MRAPKVLIQILLPSLAAGLLILTFAPAASAFKVISEFGEGAGQTRESQGVAVDFETGRLFVADTANNRIDVFDASGDFEKAFGWGVKTGEGKFEVCTTSCRKGIAGTGKGQFDRPVMIEVDNDVGGLSSPSHHAVYVVDQNNMRIQKFDAEGNFILTFGGGVNKSTGGDVCTAASGDICGSGSSGSAEGEFSSSIRMGIGPSGTIYIVDSGSNRRLQKFDPSGSPIASQQNLLGSSGSIETAVLAVDSNGDFYVNGYHEETVVVEGKEVTDFFNRIYKYDAAGGSPIDEIVDPFEAQPLQTGPLGLAVGENDHLFATASVSGTPVHIVEFDPVGTRVRSFGYGTYQQFGRDLAPYSSASGDIYASEDHGAPGFPGKEGNRVIHIDFPPPGPVIFPKPCNANPLGNSKVTLQAEVNPEGKATTYHFQYITEEDYLANGNSFSGANPASSTPESAAIGSDFKLHKASAEVSPTVPETKYRCRLVATNADAPGGIVGPEGSFTTLGPLLIGSTWSSEVGTEEATLNTEVNPLGIPTTGYFQYVDEATYQKDVAELGPEHGFDHAAKAPDVEGSEDPIDFGAGEAFKAGSATIAGLEAGTAYRYRIVATDSLIFPKEIAGPTQSLRTHASGAVALPDNRAYELVSPALKNSAEVAVPGVAGGLWGQEKSVRIQAAAGSGEAVTYTSWSSFGDAESAPSSSQYLSKRSAGGWNTENISPFGFSIEVLNPPYRGFTPDLGFGAFTTSEPLLTPQAQPGFDNLYLRDNTTGQLRALTIEAPQTSGVRGFCAGYAGASADGSRAIFAGRGAMAGAPVGEGFSLYEWSADEGLKLVSVLPDGIPAPPISANESPGEGTGFGAVGGNCKMGQAIVRNAISADGTTVFWTYGGKYKNSEQPLFARIDGTETIQLDAKVPGEKNGGKGKFWAATSDGSKAFFIAPGKLTTDAKAEGGLYRYDTEERTLTSLTPGSIVPEVRGVTGVSEDGTYAYFVASGALTGEEIGAAGQKAAKGASNLYLWHEGEGLRFIARGVAPSTASSAPTGVNGQTGRVTPDGRHLAFLSIETEALSGYDNRIFPGTGCQVATVENKLEGDPHCAQAYLYDADADELTCVSCNPSGARPTGPTELPVWSNPYEGPRVLSDDGSRLFFESRDALSAQDENGKRDVYQFEQEGSGSCDAESLDFVSASGGCLSLISSGRSEDESYLLDASSSGRDVFFSTRGSLVGWDQNENYDVYDAREGGGFPEPPPLPPICEGEACKAPPAPVPPSGSSPATATFQGQGNVLERRGKRCPKGKVRRKARCVKRHGKPRQQKRHKRRAGDARRAAR